MSPTEFRVALTSDDFERAVRFYRDGLRLDPGTCGEITEKVRYFGQVVPLWNDLNVRIQSPDGLQITLFQVNNG